MGFVRAALNMTEHEEYLKRGSCMSRQMKKVLMCRRLVPQQSALLSVHERLLLASLDPAVTVAMVVVLVVVDWRHQRMTLRRRSCASEAVTAAHRF